MRRILLVGALVASLAAPAALAADPTPADFKNAAKYCKNARSLGAEAFGAKYGTNANKKNAYGKCVSQTAKAKSEAREDAEDAAETKAASADCKKQRSEDAAKFAQTYKNLGQCVKAQKSQND